MIRISFILFLEVKVAILFEFTTYSNEYRLGEEVLASLTIANEGDALEEIFFNSGQRYDFVIKDGDREIWRWSEGKIFSMDIGKIRLQPHEKVTFTAEFVPENLRPGTYTITGIVTGTPEYRKSCYLQCFER